MKKSKFSDGQVMAILKQAEASVLVRELCREQGVRLQHLEIGIRYGCIDDSGKIHLICS